MNKFTKIFAVTFAALAATPVSAGLDGAYRKQQQDAARRNDCRQWYQAQWSAKSPSMGINRILQKPNGRLIWIDLEVEKDGAIRCDASPYNTWTAGESRLGYHKRFFKDGSGSESTVKIEGNELVSYHSSCWDWKCPRLRVSSHLLAAKLTPQKRSEQGASVAEAEKCLKAKTCHHWMIQLD